MAQSIIIIGRERSGRLVLEQQRGVFEAEVRAQGVDAAVGGGAVRAERALRRVAVEVVPAVGDLLAARLAAPQRRALRRRHEHAVVRVVRAARALCNQPRTPRSATAHHSLTRYGGRGGGMRTTETTSLVTYHNLM